MQNGTSVISSEQIRSQADTSARIQDYWERKGRSPLAYVETYGCQQNEADSERIRGMLQACGYQIADEAEGADVVVFNTCAVREHAEQRVFGNLGALQHTKRRHPSQKIFICGCMAGEDKVVSRIRERLSYYPEDIRRKKLAGNLMLMAQSGQYNYLRCLKHGEKAAAQMAAFEFARSTMRTVFLLNRRYLPYYKWSFRAMRALPELSLHAELLEYLITTDNEPEMAEAKYDVMEGIASDVIDVLVDEELTKAVCGDLGKHAQSVNDGIKDADIRNMNILAAV